jgi:hypothetical protein
VACLEVTTEGIPDSPPVVVVFLVRFLKLGGRVENVYTLHLWHFHLPSII